MQTGPLLDEAYIAAGKMVKVFRNFPLTSIHPNAMPAAKAAHCAGQQDPKLFWSLHDWLFANLGGWSNAANAADQFRKQALTLGVNSAQYDGCVQDARTEALIQRDLQEGASQGVRGTPAFLLVRVNAQGQTQTTRNLSGALPFDQFAQAIQELLAAQ
jgi:protein-disulfide isomerase